MLELMKTHFIKGKVLLKHVYNFYKSPNCSIKPSSQIFLSTMLFLNKKFDTIMITLTIHKYGPIIQYTQGEGSMNGDKIVHYTLATVW